MMRLLGNAVVVLLTLAGAAVSARALVDHTALNVQ
jgi:hypothetical protein